MSKIDQDEELDFNLEPILKQYAETRGENKFELESLLSLIKKSQASSSIFTVRLLEQLRQNVSLLTPDLFEHNIINTLLYEIKWATYYSHEPHVLGLFAEFLIDLNSAYTSYVYKSLSMLVKSLFALVNEPTTPDLIDCELLYSMAHSLIDNLFRIAPACQSQMVKIVEQSFPYMIKESYVQRAFVSNVLRLASNHAALRLPLLEICVQKLLKIDVNLNRESMIEAEKIDTDNEEEDSKTQEATTTTNKQEMKHPLADRLDTMMQCMFEYIQKSMLEPSTGQFSWERCRALYKDLLFTFDKYILSTYGSNHVQFIMFYMCSQRVQLAEGFLDYLWKKFTAINSSPITKQTCAYYIGSYLARAKYVSTEMCTASLQLMISWAHAYADKQAISQANYSDHASNFQLHRTYYSLCQTIFYVIIFRSRQLFDERFIDLVRTWKLNDIVSCKLNPLKYCFTAVRDKFAKVAYVNRVAYCYSIIDANKRISIPHSHSQWSKKTPLETTKKVGPAAALSAGNNPLDSFFPFDPYILKRSRGYVDEIYVEFRQVDDLGGSDDEMEHDEEDDEDDEDEELDEDDDDDDDEDDDDEDDDDEFDDDEEEDEYNKIVKENLKEDFYL